MWPALFAEIRGGYLAAATIARTYSHQDAIVQRVFLGIAAALIAFTPSSAAAQAGPLAALRQFGDAFNKGDVKTAAAACAVDAVIIDEFPPYESKGCTTWMDAYAADATKNQITDGVVTLGTALHVAVDVDRAYIVVPTILQVQERRKVRGRERVVSHGGAAANRAAVAHQGMGVDKAGREVTD